MFYPAIGWAVESDLSSSEKLVLMALAYRAREQPKGSGEFPCWPKIPCIASDTGLGERTVRKAIAKLNKKGLFEICVYRKYGFCQWRKYVFRRGHDDQCAGGQVAGAQQQQVPVPAATTAADEQSNINYRNRTKESVNFARTGGARREGGSPDMRKFPGEENHNDRHVTESLPEKEDWKDVLAHYEVLAAQSLGQRQAKRELATMWQRLWSARTGECATTVTVAQMAMLGKLRDELEIQKIAEIVGNWSDYVLHVRDVDGTYKGPSDPNLKFLVGHLQAAITFKAPEEEPPEGVELKFQHFERATS